MGEPSSPQDRDRVGVVVPYDFALDREMWRWVPEQVTLHVTRTSFAATPADAAQARLISDPAMVRRAAADVLTPGPAVVAYSCTSGSFVGGAAGESALRSAVLAAGAPAAVTTAGSLVAACAELGVSRLAVATPYVDDLTGLLADFLAESGVATVARHGLGLLGRIWATTPEQVAAAVRAADHPDAQAVFVSCTNLPTYDAIAALERELGKPALTANQVTMWAALRAAGHRAVGPGQSLVDGAPVPPVLRVVEPVGLDAVVAPEAAGLLKVRVRLPDESGALARLTAAVAEVGGNILSLSVHGSDGGSVVDEMLVGGGATADRLSRVIRRRLRGSGPDAVQVTPADPHELVDGPTRALDLLAVTRGRDGLLDGLAALLHADGVGTGPAPADGHVVELAAPDTPPVWARRDWAPFTVTERARGEAFLRAGAAIPPTTRSSVLLPGGTELLAAPASGEEVGELDVLLRTCLAGEPTADWTAADLAGLLSPAPGPALLLRTAAGDLVGLAALLGAGDDTGTDTGTGVPEPVVVLHPCLRGAGVGRWLRARLGCGVAA
ncbi:ACT domain-containing protein [Pseudonocardia sp. ICBG1293]|uniref:aspartate racemase/maleate isomerase family protein n=1 Tax=Pseudonocardia sp. ICBG1293 TaxID=2844382 RepID=UPI0027E01B37|nr:ACT domain-containing protein [Pseudonocardia sp. ICBG1293]